jgi:hypothetical protein
MAVRGGFLRSPELTHNILVIRCLIASALPSSIHPCPPGPPGSDPTLEDKYNMDSTSLTLLGLDLFDIRKDKEEAFEYFVCVIIDSLNRMVANICLCVAGHGTDLGFPLQRSASSQTMSLPLGLLL